MTKMAAAVVGGTPPPSPPQSPPPPLRRRQRQRRSTTGPKTISGFGFLLLAALTITATMITGVSAVDYFAPDWVIPTENIGQPYPSMVASPGDTLTFGWSRGTHDVWIYPSGTCRDELGKYEIGGINDNPTTYEFRPEEAGTTVTFVCDVGSHCEAGMIMDVNVLAADDDDGVDDVDADNGLPTSGVLNNLPTSGDGDGGETTDASAATTNPPGLPTSGGESVILPIAPNAEEAVEETAATGGDSSSAEQNYPPTPYSVCHVCGDEDRIVTNPDVVVGLPNPGQAEPFEVTCQNLYRDGKEGIIPDASCGVITQLSVIPCGCVPSNFTCDVCGSTEAEDGSGALEMKSPLNTVSLPSEAGPPLVCSDLDERGKSGGLTPAQCAEASLFAFNPCGCAPADFSCSVCGEGNAVTLPQTDFTVAGERLNCGAVELDGKAGNLSPQDCVAVEAVILTSGNVCGCAPEEGYPTCPVCGVSEEDPTVFFEPLTPDVNVTLAFNDVATCGQLQQEGVNGTMGPARCLAAQAQANANCNCGPPGGYDPCPICGLAATANGFNEDNLPGSGGGGFDYAPISRDVSLVLGGPEDASTCGELNDAGLDGRLTPARCSAAQAQAALNCNCAPVNYECNVCGVDEITGIPNKMANPSLNFTVPSASVLVNCGQLEEAGKNGTVTPQDCDTVSPLARRVCRCGPGDDEDDTEDELDDVDDVDDEEEEEDTLTPTGTVYPMCYLCGGDDGDTGEVVTNADFAFVPNDPLTCAEAEADGLAGTLEPTVCAVYGNLARLGCGCEAAAINATTTELEAAMPTPTIKWTAEPVPTPTTTVNATTPPPVAATVIDDEDEEEPDNTVPPIFTESPGVTAIGVVEEDEEEEFDIVTVPPVFTQSPEVTAIGGGEESTAAETVDDPTTTADLEEETNVVEEEEPPVMNTPVGLEESTAEFPDSSSFSFVSPLRTFLLGCTSIFTATMILFFNFV